MTWLVALAAGLVSVVVWWHRHRRAGERQRRLMQLCDRAGLRFAPMDLAVDTAWLPFPIFGRARSGTENVVWNRELGPSIRVFDHWYAEPSEQRATTPVERLTCGVVPLDAACPRLRISPRDLADDARALLGMREVSLELEAFNRRFVVESDDERFAIAFLEQRLMEGLMSLPSTVTVEVNERVMLLTSPTLLPAEQVLVLFDAAVELHERVPRSLGSLFPPRPERAPDEDRWLQGHWSPGPNA